MSPVVDPQKYGKYSQSSPLMTLAFEIKDYFAKNYQKLANLFKNRVETQFACFVKINVEGHDYYLDTAITTKTPQQMAKSKQQKHMPKYVTPASTTTSVPPPPGIISHQVNDSKVVEVYKVYCLAPPSSSPPLGSCEYVAVSSNV